VRHRDYDNYVELRLVYVDDAPEPEHEPKQEQKT